MERMIFSEQPRIELVKSAAPAVVEADTVIFDPPWEAVPEIEIKARHVLAFTDAQFFGDVIARFGTPTWVFTWDAVSCFNIKKRPLKRAKYCLWYGDGNQYDYQVARNRNKICKNPRGIRLMDVYQEPLTAVWKRAGYKHAKPLVWMEMLIGNCTAGDVIDPFAGSGTSLMACAALGRNCTGYEISGEGQAAIERNVGSDQLVLF